MFDLIVFPAIITLFVVRLFVLDNIAAFSYITRYIMERSLLIIYFTCMLLIAVFRLVLPFIIVPPEFNADDEKNYYDRSWVPSGKNRDHWIYNLFPAY